MVERIAFPVRVGLLVTIGMLLIGGMLMLVGDSLAAPMAVPTSGTPISAGNACA